MTSPSKSWVRIVNGKIEIQNPVIGEEEAARNLARPSVSLKEARTARASLKREILPDVRGRKIHRIHFQDRTSVEFMDRPRRGGESARRKRVVFYPGDHTASEKPEQLYVEAAVRTGLNEDAARALRFVSQHEGGFDAVNTWDRARFSWGFIQFAGGRGLPPMLAHFKSQSPELFHRHLGQYGVDVIANREGEPTPVYVDPAGGRYLYGDRAEQAWGDNPLLVSLFIRAGQDPEVQRLQIEAACNLYVRPALRAQSSGLVLSTVLRSPKGMAMLIDRKIHDGNCRRIARAFTGIETEVARQNPAFFEGQVLFRALQNALTQGRMVRDRLHSIYYSDLPGPV